MSKVSVPANKVPMPKAKPMAAKLSVKEGAAKIAQMARKIVKNKSK